MTTLLEEIQRRWQQQFEALASGSDVSPSQRLRTEGLMEAAVIAGAATAEQLTEKMEAAYKCAFGATLCAEFGEDWQQLFPFPQIPAMMHRAPVVPSTSD